MMAAEKWYEYQENYKRYGFDMKPKVQRKAIEKIKPKTSPAVSAKEKIALFMLTIFIGALGVGLILATAYAANVKYQINGLIKQNAVIEGEIENLNVKIESANRIQHIEYMAINEIGMVYPATDQVIVLDKKMMAEDGEKLKDFALVLKEQAYN